MIRGIHQSAAAMFSEMLRQDVHAHNLANADTVGFRRHLGRAVGEAVDMTPGDVRMTGAPLDLALRGNGFFVLETGAGRHYTRDGRFTLNAQGNLVSAAGLPVLGQRGPITLQAARIEVGADGSIHADGQYVDRLLVVDFPPGSRMEHRPGGGFGADRPPAQVGAYTVAAGALEVSNVKPTRELAAMQSGFRIYEANARAISHLERTMAKLIEATTG